MVTFWFWINMDRYSKYTHAASPCLHINLTLFILLNSHHIDCLRRWCVLYKRRINKVSPYTLIFALFAKKKTFSLWTFFHFFYILYKIKLSLSYKVRSTGKRKMDNLVFGADFVYVWRMAYKRRHVNIF